MDNDFLTRARDCIKFSLTHNDLISNNHKLEVRKLISDEWFNNVPAKIFKENISLESLNKSINHLKLKNSNGFNKLFNYKLQSSGAGELLLYYLLDNCSLYPPNERGRDVQIDNTDYEIKAVKLKKHKILNGTFVYDFKLGTSLDLIDIIYDLKILNKNNGSNIPGSEINKLRGNPLFNKIENRYRNEAIKYFNKHNVIFFDISHSNNNGNILLIDNIKKENIYIERVTQGTIKPLIRI